MPALSLLTKTLLLTYTDTHTHTNCGIAGDYTRVVYEGCMTFFQQNQHTGSWKNVTIIVFNVF